ncbi:hypothetical protein F443_22332, partial [Phytophthora nicotianae P1569]
AWTAFVLHWNAQTGPQFCQFSSLAVETAPLTRIVAYEIRHVLTDVTDDQIVNDASNVFNDGAGAALEHASFPSPLGV